MQLAPIKKATKEAEAAAQSSLLRRVEASRARFEVKIAQHEAVAAKREVAQVLRRGLASLMFHLFALCQSCLGRLQTYEHE